MDTRIFKTNINKVDIKVEEMKIFDWKLKDKVIENDIAILTFERDDSTPYYLKLNELEKEYYKQDLFPSWPIFLSCGLALLFLILFTIFFFVKRDLVFNLFIWIFLLPGVVCLLLAVVFSYLRMKSINNFIKTNEERQRNIILEVEKLRNGGRS